MTQHETLEPIDLFFDLMTNKGNVFEIVAGPMRLTKIMLENTSMLLMVQLNKEAAIEVAREGYWYKEFYMASLAIARGLNMKYPPGQMERLQDRLSTAERTIVRMKMNIQPSTVRRIGDL